MKEKKLTKIWDWFLKVPELIIEDQGLSNLVDINHVLQGIPEDKVENNISRDNSNEDE